MVTSLPGRYLSFEEREEIVLLKAHRVGVRTCDHSRGREGSVDGLTADATQRNDGYRSWVIQGPMVIYVR